MASRRLDDLTVGTYIKLRKVMCRMEVVGFPLLVYCTRRSPEEQAKLWRRSRARIEIAAAVRKLRPKYPQMAKVLLSVGPQIGPLGRHVTNALPGQSWHQYGMAFDACPIIDGKLAWAYPAGTLAVEWAWKAYGKAVVDAGLHWAGDWDGWKEMPHAQNSPDPNPMNLFENEQALLEAMHGPLADWMPSSAPWLINKGVAECVEPT